MNETDSPVFQEHAIVENTAEQALMVQCVGAVMIEVREPGTEEGVQNQGQLS